LSSNHLQACIGYVIEGHKTNADVSFTSSM